MGQAALKVAVAGRAAATGKKAPAPVDKHVGGRVRMRRMVLGMSQEGLAQGLGVSFQQVQKYEKGTNRMGASRLQQVAERLAVPVSFFFEGMPGGDLRNARQGDLGAMDPMFDMSQRHDGVALAKAFNAITDSESRTLVVKLAEILASSART